MTSGQAISKLKHDKKYANEVIEPLEKEHKVLKIIKEELLNFRFHDDIQQVWISTKDDLSFIICQNIKDKDKYDLLKKVLL